MHSEAEAFAWEHYCLGHRYTVYPGSVSRVTCDCGEHYGYADTLNGFLMRLFDAAGVTPHLERLASWLARRLP